MARRVLVTGAAGFVGAVLARKLIEDGHDVHLMLRPESDRWRLDGVEAPVHVVDLDDRERLATIVPAIRAEWIFHLAAYGGYATQTDWRRMVEANVIGTMNLVDASLRRGFDAFVNAGSSSEYGFKRHAPKESEVAEPASAYAVTKLSQTLFCRLAARMHDAHIVTLRLYSVYGPYESPSRFLPTLIVNGLRGELPPLVSPRIARDFIFTEDVSEAFLSAAGRSDVDRGSIYNVGTGRQVTIAEAVALARQTFGLAVEPEWNSMENRTWDTETWRADASKIESELGWRPRVGFEDGFLRFTHWIRANLTRYHR